MIIFDKHYTSESLTDLEQHIWDVLNDNIAELPTDENGFTQGSFRVTINWTEE